MTDIHKVGEMHYNGLIMADAIKSDNSGNTVSMYQEADKSGYSIVEWDNNGQFGVWSVTCDNYEEAVISYVNRTFGISL